MNIRAREHNHSHHVVHISETKGRTDDESDFIVGGLGACVGESESGSGNDSREVALDFPAQFPKCGDSAPLGPGYPFGEGAGDLIRHRQRRFPRPLSYNGVCDGRSRIGILLLRGTHGQFNFVHLGADRDVFQDKTFAADDGLKKFLGSYLENLLP